MAVQASAHERWIEDLPAQARRALILGRAHCVCEGHYHTIWGSLRAADVANSLKREETLLNSLIAPLVRSNAKILIGGAADPGVLCAFGRIYAPQLPAFTIIDRCRAPLALIGEFAGAKGFACRTLNGDLLDLYGREQWDQIVLHYTPDFFAPERHAPLFRSVARSLAPNGTLILAAMTGAQGSGEQLQTLGSVYFDYGLSAIRNSTLADLTEDPDFMQMLRIYAMQWGRRRMNLPTLEALHASLHGAGLRILSEHNLPRKHRVAGDANVVDSTSIIVASHAA